jgi:hypothetical protein
VFYGIKTNRPRLLRVLDSGMQLGVLKIFWQT